MFAKFGGGNMTRRAFYAALFVAIPIAIVTSAQFETGRLVLWLLIGGGSE
jgi:hypothetical protein